MGLGCVLVLSLSTLVLVLLLQQQADGRVTTDCGTISSLLRATSECGQEMCKVTTAQLGHSRSLQAGNLAAAATNG